MRGRSDEVCVRHWVRVNARSHETSDVCHVYKEVSTYLLSNLPHALEIDFTWVSRSTGGDERWLEFYCSSFKRVVVDLLVSFAHAVVLNFVELTREVCLVAVSEVTTVREIHSEDLVAWLEN